jgi:hypothetical protein
MNTPDQDIVLTVILGNTLHSARDTTGTMHRLIAVLDRDEVVHALDRMKRRRTLRLVE